jgi:hypothetical protein
MALLEVSHNPSRTELRLFGGVWLPLALLFLAWNLARRQPESVWPWLLAGVAVAAALAGWLAPHLIRWIYVGAMYLAFPIGWVVSHLILGLVFYTLVTGIALVMRLRGRDVLGLSLDREATSYWTPHETVTDPGRYFRQF